MNIKQIVRAEVNFNVHGIFTMNKLKILKNITDTPYKAERYCLIFMGGFTTMPNVELVF